MNTSVRQNWNMAHEEIGRVLAECQETGEFVAYHKWGSDPSSFLVGVVEELSSTSVVFRDIDTLGNYEGVPHRVALRLIHTLDRRTQYLWRLQTLHDLGNPDPIDQRESAKPAQIRTILEEAARETAIARIWTAVDEANDYLVFSVGDDVVNVSDVVDGGQSDGRSMIRLKRIVRVRVGRSESDDLRVHRHWERHGYPSMRVDILPGL